MAFSRSAQRIYDRAAVEARFRNFDPGWEAGFTRAELREGRRLYRAGCVKALELRDRLAVASLRLEDGSEPYCVLDFEGSGFSVRGSSGDDSLNRIYAVAGMYEVEELVADEASPIGYAPPPAAAPEAPAPEEPARAPVPEASMKMALQFKLGRDSLSFTVFWKTPAGLVPAFGDGGMSAAGLNGAEREKLVRIASLARKAGFSYDGRSYGLSDTSKFPHFVSKVLPEWRRHFEIRKPRDVDMLALGAREVSLSVDLGLSGDSIDADFHAELDGRRLGFDELRLLHGGGGRGRILPGRGLVKISEGDGELISSARRAFEFFGGKIPKYMLFTLFDGAPKLRVPAELAKWKKAVLSRPELPGGLEFLRPYQREGVSRMLSLFGAGCGMLLADEMGLGKTVQTLAAISKYWDGAEKFIIACPASVIPVWRGEAEKFFPEISVCVLDSSSDLSAPGGAVWLASYTQLRRNKQKADAVRFKIAVLDEAQFIKNPDSKVSQACMSLNADFRAALSGTPIENRLLDIWTIFRFLMPGLMGARSDFERRIASEPEFSARVRRQIAPFVMRRLKNEVASELPPKNFVDLPCPMTDMQNAEYSRLLDSAREAVKSGAAADSRGRVSILSVLTRLRQAACDPALLPWIGPSCDISNSGKISAITEALASVVSSGRRAVVFSQFTSFLARIRGAVAAAFPEAELFELTGSTRDRAAPVGLFQSSKGAAVIFVSMRAGGTGITLTGADYVFIADPWWNPAVEEQAVDRVHRIGRKRDVFVYRLVADSTVEESVRRLQAAKRRLFEDVMGGLEGGGRPFEEAVREILEI